MKLKVLIKILFEVCAPLENAYSLHLTFPNVSSPNEKTKFIHKVSCGLLSQVTNRRGDG